MNSEVTSENDNEKLETKIENDQNTIKMEIVVKENLEVNQEIRRKKI